MTDLVPEYDAPLEDPDYQPLHPPINGHIPPVIARWGPRSQRRWFDRFWDQLRAQPYTVWQQYHVHSTAHRGPCCPSCESDRFEGYADDLDDRCCCKAYHSQVT